MQATRRTLSLATGFLLLTLGSAGAEIGVKLPEKAAPVFSLHNRADEHGGTALGMWPFQNTTAPVFFAAKNGQPRTANNRLFSALAQSDSLAPKPRKNPTGAMLRAIAFPGWGQFYNGKLLKALIVFGVEAGFIGAAIYYNQKAHDDQDSALNREFYAEQRNTNYWRTGVVILLSMLDAYVDAHLSDFDESPDLSLRAQPGFSPHADGVSPELHLSLRVAF